MNIDHFNKLQKDRVRTLFFCIKIFKTKLIKKKYYKKD